MGSHQRQHTSSIGLRYNFQFPVVKGIAKGEAADAKNIVGPCFMWTHKAIFDGAFADVALGGAGAVLPHNVCYICYDVIMDPAMVVTGVTMDHPPVRKTHSNLLVKVNLAPTGIPQAYFTNGGIANLVATKALIEAKNNVFAVGELNSYNAFATDTFEDWVESVFNRCAFEVLVFRLREMYVGRGVYMTAMTRIQAARQEVLEGGKAKVLTVSLFFERFMALINELPYNQPYPALTNTFVMALTARI